ncbi:MAG: hypothetical protein OXM61_16625 [Candidatus Poribacteria bacterium]|nr:hypothetical protein [Candidatus Poribacteria bacterium]
MQIPKGQRTTPEGEQQEFGDERQDRLAWIMEGLRRLEDKFDKITEQLNEVKQTVRDIQTSEKAIKDYKKEAKENTKDRRDFVIKIITIILIGIGATTTIVTLIITLTSGTE